MTTGAAARMLGVSQNRVRQLCNGHVLSFVRVMGRALDDVRIIEVAAVEQLVRLRAARACKIASGVYTHKVK